MEITKITWLQSFTFFDNIADTLFTIALLYAPKMISGDLKICILNADNILLDKVLAIEKMIGKFSRIKEINHFYCAGLLPNINDRCLSLQKTERNDQKTLQGSPKKDRVLTLEKMREKLRKQIQGGRSNTVGTL